LSRYCLPLADLRSETLIRQFGELESHAQELKPYIDSRMRTYRAALDEQYRGLLGVG
jgi:hypothetical protein